MRKVVIIADDLTGANDTGLQFHNRGFRTAVLTEIGKLSEFLGGYDVLCIDSGTRGSSGHEARRKVGKIASAIGGKVQNPIIYKKVDSTLRGNIAVETEVIMDRAGFDYSIIAPAYPSQGRQTVDGAYLVNLTPISDTEFAHDPTSPVRESHLPSIIKGKVKREVKHISHGVLKMGIEGISKEIDSYDKSAILTFDVVSDEDLYLIAKAGLEMESLPLFVGSAGLAKLLREEMPQGKGGGLIIAGSLSEVTSKQVEIASKEGAYLIHLTDRLISADDKSDELSRSLSEEIEAKIEEGNDVTLWTGSDEPSDSSTVRSIYKVLEEVSVRLVENPNLNGLVLTGGETASRVFARLRISALEIEDEVLPVIPCCRVAGGEYSGLRIITKAGAYGREDALAKCLEFLRRKSEQSGVPSKAGVFKGTML